jgi:hypothetical protein
MAEKERGRDERKNAEKVRRPLSDAGRRRPTLPKTCISARRKILLTTAASPRTILTNTASCRCC